ncbi:hypothetical protein [Sphingobacterium faecale]|uniref:Uncharacterized protein n=1 Tax=Sphingobacterium faecale TaxID=2803775 RepID=A0ABS1R2D1_9SPHI|nr:hypothetical protein [Sphingobacterium faecale]MBL1408867.1 hypothetical protein [Sphingobacterium faecale]
MQFVALKLKEAGAARVFDISNILDSSLLISFGKTLVCAPTNVFPIKLGVDLPIL